MIAWTLRCVLAAALLGGALEASSQTQPEGWRIRFDASRAGLVDKARLTVGASTAASNGADDLDQPHPPALPSRYLDLTTRHTQTEPGWAGQALPTVRYRAEYLAPLGSTSATIVLFLETDSSGPITLSWTMTPDLDLASHFATLRDPATGAAVDMWAQASYPLTVAPGSRTLRVELVPGRIAPPVAYDQAAATDEDTQAPIVLLAEDAGGAVLAYAIVAAPAHGAVTGDGPTVSYVPAADYHGLDAFSFVASNGSADSNLATVSITVRPVNDAPTAAALSVTIDEDTPVSITLAGADVDSDALSFSVSAAPLHGTLDGSGPAITYTPAADFNGTDSFSYVANDGVANSVPAGVSIAVAAVHDAPRAGFTVPGPGRNAATWDNNVGSSFEGARFLAATSQNPSRPATNALDDNINTEWQSASGQRTNQSITVELPAGEPPIDRLRLVNGFGFGGAAVKHFEVRVSTTTSDPTAFATVLADVALDNFRVQEFVFATPVAARYVEFKALDNFGSACCVAIRSLELIAPALAGIPSYPSAPTNAALALEGASVVASSEFSPSFGAALAIDGSLSTRWASGSGQAVNQSLTVSLAREKTYLVERIRVANAFGAAAQAVKDFSLAVSNTTGDASAFTTVLSGRLADVSGLQDFVVPGGPVAVRHVRFTALNNYGSTCCVSIQELQVVPVAGAVPSVSSYQDASTRPELALDDKASTLWWTASGQATDQHLELRMNGPATLASGVRIQSSTAPGAGNLKDFEVLVSDTTDADAAFSPVLSGSVPNDGLPHVFTFPGGAARARFVRLVARNNHGAPSTSVASFEVLTLATEGHLLTAHATLLGVSSEYPGFGASKALDLDPAAPGWVTAVGQTTNQWLKLELPSGRSWLVDHVVLQPRADGFADQSPKEFEVQVSTTSPDDTAFTGAYAGTLRSDGSVQHFFFAAVEARYIRLLLKNNYGGPNVGVQGFAAYSPEIGAADARFLDVSEGRDAPLRDWQWSFGDGSASTDRDPGHLFAQAGTYDVTLTTTDSSGVSSSLTRPYLALAPTAVAFDVAPGVPAEGQAARFSDTSTDPAGIVYREWFFGDGSQLASVQPSASHAFPDNGTYAVTLRATNAWGVVSGATASVSVVNAPPVVDAGTDARLIIGAAWLPSSVISDPGAADGASLSCAWTFGDGESQQIAACDTLRSRTPHVYATPGAYRASLTVTDKDGAATTDGVTVTVFPAHAALGDGTYLEPAFWGAYGIKELAKVPGFSSGNAGLAFKFDDPDTLLIAGPAIQPSGKIYTVRVARDAQGHVTGFSGSASVFANYPNNDGGLVYGPGNVLFSARWPAQTLDQFKAGSTQIERSIVLPPLGPTDVALGFVPNDLPGACRLKFVNYFSARWWSAEVVPDAAGTFGLTGIYEAQAIHDGGVEHLAYAPRGSPLFDAGTVLVTEYDLGNVAAYATDANGDPIPGSRRLVVTGLTTPEAFAFDPLTGDLLISTPSGSRSIRRITGFPAPNRNVTLSPAVATADVGASHTLTARVVDGRGSGRAGVPVTLAVSAGSNAGSTGWCDGGCVTDAAGEVRFSYQGTHPGEDTLTASFTTDRCDSRSVQARVLWTTTNRPPVAISQRVSTPEDAGVAVTLAGTDQDGDALSFDLASQPAHGTLSGAAPDLTYTPAPNFHGTDSFGFLASDGDAASAAATVAIDVVPVNDSPLAVAQTALVTEDASTTLELVASDVDGDSLSFVIVAPPEHGTVAGTGSTRTYLPAADFAGTDSFSFAASDGLAQSAAATVTLVVNAVNDAPVAHSQALAALETTPLAITLVATDVESSAIAYTIVSPPQHGSLSGAAPHVTYSPAPGFVGSDSFRFEASDGESTSNAAKVAIEVAANNHAPVAFDASATTTEDTPVSVTLVAADPDLDLLAYLIVTPPTHGTLSGSAPNLAYTPAANEHGPDSFSFQVSDGELSSNVANVTIAVSASNDRPVAADQSLEVTQGVGSPVVLTATDVDGDALTYTIVASPAHASLSGTAPNLVYTSAPGYTGADAFTFLVNDGRADSDVATVSLSVVGVSNHAPSCASAQPSVAQLWPPNHKMKSLQVNGVTDADGDPVTILAKSIRQDEPVEGTGDGNRSPDATLTPLQLRAERSGGGNGRVYHVQFEATDDEGARCTGTVRVCVPHDQSGASCIDAGPLHDSTVEHH